MKTELKIGQIRKTEIPSAPSTWNDIELKQEAFAGVNEHREMPFRALANVLPSLSLCFNQFLGIFQRFQNF